MILLDTNILLYASAPEMPGHARIRHWLDGKLNDNVRVGIPWVVLMGFLRIATHRRAFERPKSIQQTWNQIHAWLNHPSTWIPQPTQEHSRILKELTTVHGVHGDLVTDAHLATLAIEHGLILCSADRGFARFKGLRWENPLDR